MAATEGACPLHPAIRLKRYNRRTGEWKTLLETCPLCASGLPASGGAAERDDDDDGTVDTRSSRASRRSALSGERSARGAVDATRRSSGRRSLSGAGTRKQSNGADGGYGEGTRGYDSEVSAQCTEDEEEEGGDLDGSSRSGCGRGVRFGPGTKEASEKGTELEAEEAEANYLKETLHSHSYGQIEDDDKNRNANYNSTSFNSTSTSTSSQYSNTPSTTVRAPSALRPSSFGPPNKDEVTAPSALRPTSFGPSHPEEVAPGTLVLYDGGARRDNRGASDFENSLTSDNFDPRHQDRQEKQKYRPPPPPRRDESPSPGDRAGADRRGAARSRGERSESRSRGEASCRGAERSASRSRDARPPSQPQRSTSQPRSSSRARGGSSRGRDSSRSRAGNEEATMQASNGSCGMPAPPPRAMSRSRQPSRSRGREDRQPSGAPQQPPPPVGILKNAGRSNSINSMTPKDMEELNAAAACVDENASRHSNHSRQPPPPRSSQGMSPPNNNSSRMRMEPPETPQDELDNYSINSRDSNARRHTAPARPPNQSHPLPGPQDPRRRVSETSRRFPNMNNAMMPQPPRSGPMYTGDPRDIASMNSHENRATPPSRGVPPTDRLENVHEYNQPRQAKNAPKKSARRPMDQPGLTESETNVSDSGNADNNDSEAPVMAQASEYDDKGRCVKHPHIKLRKKKMLGGWKVMLVNCPDCCIEEMLKMRRNGPGRAGQAGAKNDKKRSPSEDSHSSGAHPPISQLTIRNKNDNDDHSSSSGSASEITYGTKTDFSRSSAMGGGSWQQYGGGPNGSVDNTSGSGPHRVTRMPFTDAYGHKGWYTGEVASGSGLPHGKGTMHYCDGRMRGGLWSNGLAAQGGGGDASTQRASKVGGSGSSVSSSHSGQLSRNQHPPPGREAVVVGMEWMDLDGRCGHYTGETDEQRLPHGIGSMRYHDGKVVEGEWYHGEFERQGGGRGDASVKSGRSRGRGTAF